MMTSCLKRNLSETQKTSFEEEEKTKTSHSTSLPEVDRRQIFDIEGKLEKTFKNPSKKESAKEDEIQLENKILKNVFAIEIPGVRITHCNFGRHEVQVIYTMEEAETRPQESVEKELRSVIESFANGRYKVKLARKRGLPVFRHTSPGQRINVGGDASSIGAYVTLTGRPNELFALVTGHGKREGDEAYSATDPSNVIGTVEVAREDTTQHVQVAGSLERDLSCYYDIGLARISDEEQSRLQAVGNINEVNGVKLAPVSASIPQSDLGNGDHVMLFAEGNKEGQIYSRRYNSINVNGVIGIVDKASVTAIHQPGDSGTMVVSSNTYSEVPGGTVLTQAIGMLTGIEELDTESVSLAVPISKNLEILRNDVFHGDHEIEFA